MNRDNPDVWLALLAGWLFALFIIWLITIFMF